jgi:hypothetical protein
LNSAETYRETDIQDDRARDLEYFHGQMDDVPPSANGSKIVATTIADTIGWMLPSIMKIFTGSSNFARALPGQPGDEAVADQATDALNYIFWNQNEGYEVVHSGTFDALLHADGIIKVHWDDTPEYRVSTHSGVSAEELEYLLGSGELLAQQETVETVMVETPEGPMEQQVPVFDIKMKKKISSGRIKIDAIEPWNYLRDRSSTTHSEARVEAHRMDEVTRSDLVEMGFDKDDVEDLPIYQRASFSEEDQANQPELVDINDTGDHSMDIIELYEVYIKVDVDGDGIAETVRAYYAGAQGAGRLLRWEVYDDGSPFVRIPCEPIPHRWQSRSVADQTRDMQKVETVMIRQLLTNVYDSVNPRPMFREGDVKNPDSLTSPKHGQPIILKRGAPPIDWTDTPFVGTQLIPVFEHIEREIHKRTGTSPGMMAVDPESLQEVAATTGQNNTDAARMKVEQVARNMAKMGWVYVFRKMYQLFVRHQDQPLVFRLRDEWVDIDPRDWNADMDVEINVGLGTGSRDRDIIALQAVLMNQMQAAEAPTLPPEKKAELAKMIRNTMVEMAEAAGLRNPEGYFPKITEEDQQAMVEQMSQQPDDPEAAAKAEAIQADSQAKQQAAQADTQMKAQKAESAAQIEQMAAQARIAEQKAENDFRREMERAQAESAHEFKLMALEADTEVKKSKADADITISAGKIDAETQLKREQVTEELALARELGYEELALKKELAEKGADTSINVSSVDAGGEPG